MFRILFLMAAVIAPAVAPTPVVITKITPSPQSPFFAAKRLSIESKLPPLILARLQAIARGPQAKPDADGGTTTLFSAVRAQFPQATPDQVKLLAFIVEERAAQSALDAQTVTTQQQVRSQLQQEEYTQFAEALSNLLKSISSTSESIVSNLKP